VRTLVGTSGYSYAPWRGVFYPEKLPAEKMLAYYASRLPTVEINNTFYRLPSAELLARWAAEVPASFSFALKAPRRITHERRLAGAEDTVGHFLAAATALASKLGPVLFQLPPFLRKDLPRLEAFLKLLRQTAPAARAAFEFRHDSWFVPEVFAALRAGGAALCLSDSEELATPVEATADWGYLRLRRQDYSEEDLQAWAGRIRRQPWEEVHVFFKHEDEGKGPLLAETLSRQLAGA
jgi:uncharacterized protein YecE (DUF72 family)